MASGREVCDGPVFPAVVNLLFPPVARQGSGGGLGLRGRSRHYRVEHGAERRPQFTPDKPPRNPSEPGQPTLHRRTVTAAPHRTPRLTQLLKRSAYAAIQCN
jgi:hypothetical protein